MHNPPAAVTRILVVDDEHLIADTTVAVLRQGGFEATASYSGTDAVREAARVCPDIVLCDYFMPGMNGLEAARQIRGFCPRVKIVLLSGQASALDFLAQLDEQELDYQLLAKPIHPDILLATLRGCSLS